MSVINQFQVIRALSPEEKEDALTIRFEVFIKEQGVSPDVESDEYDAIDPHWLVLDDLGKPIATARLTDKSNGVGKLERVAILKEYRGMGIGRLIVDAIERDAKAMGFHRIVLHSQTHCQVFYEKSGYVLKDSTVFYEDDIPHVSMSKQL